MVRFYIQWKPPTSHWVKNLSLMFILTSAEIEGLKRKLTSKLGANSPSLQPDWQVQIISSLFVRKFIYWSYICSYEELASSLQTSCRLVNVWLFGGDQTLKLLCILIAPLILRNPRYVDRPTPPHSAWWHLFVATLIVKV